MKYPEYSIINSFDPFDGVIFILNKFKCMLRIALCTLTGDEQKRLLRIRKLELLQYCGGNLYGHRSLNLGMIRGFKRLGIPFLWNRVTKHTKCVILLWCRERELKNVAKIKRKYPHVVVVAAPTGCFGDIKKFIESPAIDYISAASAWHKKSIICSANVDKNLQHKLFVWPTGVQVDSLTHDNGKINMSVLCYYKLVPENPKITQYLESHGIKTHVLNYGAYQLEDYRKLLDSVDFMIDIQDIVESQGLAVAEAWAKNRPTIIKHNVNAMGGETCPYLTRDTGMFYDTDKDLFKIIDEYVAGPEKFLKKFKPYKVASEKFSDEACIRYLIDFLKKTI